MPPTENHVETSITDVIVIVKTESELESRFEEIRRTYPKYGKNEISMNRYLSYHREIQTLMNRT